MDELSRGMTAIDIKMDKVAQANTIAVEKLRSELTVLITKEINDIEKRTETNAKDIQNILVALGKLEVKSGVWGAIGGVIAILGMMLVTYLKGG